MRKVSDELRDRYLAGVYGDFIPGGGVSYGTHIRNGTLNILAGNLGKEIGVSVKTKLDDVNFHFGIYSQGSYYELYVSPFLPYAGLLLERSEVDYCLPDPDDPILVPASDQTRGWRLLREKLNSFGVILLGRDDLLRPTLPAWGIHPDGQSIFEMLFGYDNEYVPWEVTDLGGVGRQGTIFDVLNMYLETMVGHPHPASQALLRYREGIHSEGFSSLGQKLEAPGRTVRSKWRGSSWCYEIVDSAILVELWISATLPYVFLRARPVDSDSWRGCVSEELKAIVASLPVLALSWEDLVLESAYRIDQDSRKMTYFEMLFTAGRPFFVPE